MPIRFGPTELILIIVIIILLFGVGRISKIAGELGSGIRSFRKGLQQEEEDQTKEDAEKQAATVRLNLLYQCWYAY